MSSADSTIDCVKGRSYRLDEFLLGHIGNIIDTSDLAEIAAKKIAKNKNNTSV